MFCPECGAEYREGYDRCAECDVDLVDQPPPPEDHSTEPYVEVFETSEIDVIPVIKSILRGAGIPFNTSGEAMMNLFPNDLLGPMMGRSASEMRFSVPESRAEEARDLLMTRPLEALEAAAAKSGEDDD